MATQDFLFNLSFLKGMAGLFDLGRTFFCTSYPYYGNVYVADNRALRKDWEAVGSDFLAAMKEFGSAKELRSPENLKKLHLLLAYMKEFESHTRTKKRPTK